MPTFITDAPLGPDQERTIDAAIAFGKQQWQTTWRIFARQWTQPGLIKLAAETLKCRALHSSQISGFQNGQLRDPSPKLLVAIGLLNEAIARSNGHLQTEGLRCPGVRKELWQGKQHLLNPDGTPMGPTDVFAAVAGLVDLGVDSVHVVPTGSEEAASKAVGRFMRSALAKAGLDWLEALPELSGECALVEPLLMGRTVDGDHLIRDLPALAGVIGSTPEELWSLAIQPALELPE